MKLTVWLPGIGRTSRQLLWVPKLSSRQCAVTPISEQLLDAIRVSVVMLDWSLKWTSHWCIRTLPTTRDRTNRPLLFRDRISNCTNLFRPKPNRTTRRSALAAVDHSRRRPDMCRSWNVASASVRRFWPQICIPIPHTGSQPQPCVQSIGAWQAGSPKNN